MTSTSEVRVRYAWRALDEALESRTCTGTDCKRPVAIIMISCDYNPFPPETLYHSLCAECYKEDLDHTHDPMEYEVVAVIDETEVMAELL